MSDDKATRRRFLKVVAEGGAAIGAVTVLGCGSGTTPVTGAVSAGNVSALSAGTLKFVTGQPLVIARDSKGVYAMTSICTHQQCDMSHQGSANANGVFCSCHGSQFDANGNPQSGPAHSALQHYAVTIDSSGAMTVHGDQSVAADTRTPVATG